MKKLSINIPNDKYYDYVSGKVNGKDLVDCDYEDIYDFSKTMLKAVAVGKLEDPPIEVGDVVIKSGGVFNEIYGIVTHKENDIYTVMFNDGHTVLVLEDGLHPVGSNYKDLLTKVFEHIKEGVRLSIK